VIALSYSRRRKKFRGIRIAVVLFLVILFINSGNIGRFFFPIPYRSIIFREAALTGLDGYLLAAIIKTESNFNAGAVSAKGARGLMQVMPETGKWVAGQWGINGYNKDLLFNPELNIKIGALYITDLYREFKGDTILVLAAYNAGRGNVKKWLEQNDWTGEPSSIDQIPFPETRQFIRKVMFYQKAYRHFYFSVSSREK
jgi:soluble lytic murein transglycosylase